MSKKLTKILLVSLCFSLAGDVQALLLPSPTPSILPIPQRPMTFPLQRPTRVGDVVTWSYGSDINPPANLDNVVQISAGSDFIVALKGDGTVVQWGRSGQNSVPSDLENVVQVAAGFDYSLALKDDGTVVSWGAQMPSDMPNGLSNVVQIAAGDYINLALKNDGSIIVWGYNTSGFTQPEGVNDVAHIAAGIDSAIALKSDGTVIAWGHSWDEVTTPTGLSNIVQVSAGDRHNIALKNDGTIVAWAWGSGSSGETPALHGVVQISAFDQNAIARKSDGTVVAWGYSSQTPNVPDNLNNVIQVSAGGTHSVALVHKEGSMIPVQGGVSASGTAVADFEIGKYEVTWGEWQEVRNWSAAKGYTDLVSAGNGTSANHPVRDVNWHDAVKWCNAKSEKEGLTPVYSLNGSIYRSGESGGNLVQKNDAAGGYRLPTQAEWQWAAGGGVSTSGFTYSGSNDLSAVGWYAGNTNGTTSVVGSKAANELGVYDMSGNVMEWCEGLHLGAYRLLRGGSFTKTTDWCTVSFPGLTIYDARAWDFGFRLARGVGSVTPTPTPTPEPSPTPVDFAGFAGTYIGNFVDVDAADSAEAFMKNGQLLITVKSNRKFTGALFFNGRKTGFRGRFDANGNWNGEVMLAGYAVEMEMLLERGEVGKRISSLLIWNGEDATDFAILPVAYSGGGGNVFAWNGSRLNVLFQSAEASGYSFGYGYAGVTCAKDGVMRFAGKLADNTAWSGVARVVENEAGGTSIPLAVRLPNGLLHGEMGIYVNPEEGEAEMESTSPWLWIRQANAKSKTFAAGFEEELDVEGRLWAWTKGTSAFGGNTANFTLTLSAPVGASLPTGADSLTGNLSASNRVMWSQSPPRGFSMKISPATGLVSGKVPATQDGKSVMLIYQGILFSENVDSRSLKTTHPVYG